MVRGIVSRRRELLDRTVITDHSLLSARLAVTGLPLKDLVLARVEVVLLGLHRVEPRKGRTLVDGADLISSALLVASSRVNLLPGN